MLVKAPGLLMPAMFNRRNGWIGDCLAARHRAKAGLFVGKHGRDFFSDLSSCSFFYGRALKYSQYILERFISFGLSYGALFHS